MPAGIAVSQVCLSYGVSETEIVSESRARDLSHVRAVISLLAGDVKGVSIMEAARKLKRDPGGLSRLASKFERKCNSEPSFKQELLSVKAKLLQFDNKSISHV